MATLILSTVGTVLGGPIGSAVGALIGNQIDQALFKPKGREGPRLKELTISNSSYGTPMPRHFGRMRAGGSMIWATDLVESSENIGGGKGKPSVTTFSYSSSFAIVLGSRPIESIGRIWADGNLLRGAAGDLKVGGEFRFHSGHGDQQRDPLLASAEGPLCPAYRGLAYCVFENLQLADFGNRIPALSFEVIAETGEVELQEILRPLDFPTTQTRPLVGLQGFSDEGGPLRGALEVLDSIYPLSCDAGSGALSFPAQDAALQPVFALGEPVIDPTGEDFGAVSGQAAWRKTEGRSAPAGLRYYDVERDYLVGLQRAGGQSRAGRNAIIEFPGSLEAGQARWLANDAARRASWAHDFVQLRLAELDPSLTPGALTQLPDRAGLWRVSAWEWREFGIELELYRLPASGHALVTSDAGRNLSTLDEVATPSILLAAELPWDGQGSSQERQVVAAVSSSSGAWTGAVIYADQGGSLAALVGSGNQRSIIGHTLEALPAGMPHIVERGSAVEVQLVSDQFSLASRPVEDLAMGANRALIGAEVIQFACAENMGEGRWRLSGLLRGRGGTEAKAAHGSSPGAPFILLDNRPVLLPPSGLGDATSVAAIGLADDEAAVAAIANAGASLTPLTPVHPRISYPGTGGIELCWTRRARGAWQWPATVEPPLVEQAEEYEVGLGNTDQALMVWQVSQPRLTLDATTLANLQASHSGEPLWVRQIGSHARSAPLLLLTIS